MRAPALIILAISAAVIAVSVDARAQVEAQSVDPIKGERDNPIEQETTSESVEGEGGEVITSPLDQLAWLVGNWVDEDESTTVETSIQWTKNNSYLLRSFRSSMDDSETTLSGIQIIAWDPANERIHSWTFDSDGGFGEGAWSQSDTRWTIRATFTLATGERASALHTLTYIDEDSFTWRTTSREIGGELLPDLDPVLVVRAPLEVVSALHLPVGSGVPVPPIPSPETPKD